MLKEILNQLPDEQKNKIMMGMINHIADDFANIPPEEQPKMRKAVTELVVNLRQAIKSHTDDLVIAEKALNSIEAYYDSLTASEEVQTES